MNKKLITEMNRMLELNEFMNEVEELDELGNPIKAIKVKRDQKRWRSNNYDANHEKYSIKHGGDEWHGDMDTAFAPIPKDKQASIDKWHSKARTKRAVDIAKNKVASRSKTKPSKSPSIPRRGSR